MSAWTPAAPREATHATHARGVHIAGLQQLSWALLVTSVLLYFCFSAHALLVLGIPYDVPMGAFPAKIHPGTYLLMAAWMAGLGAQGNPLASLGRQVRQQPLLSGALACMAGVFAWACWRHGPSGLAFILDTLCMPCVLALTVLLQPRVRQRQLLMLLMALLMANAVLAIGEFMAGKRLIPLFPLLERAEEDYFRSSALLGHPLANALTVIVLLPAMELLPWSLLWRGAAMLLVTMGLLTFGSRSSLAGLMLYLLLVTLPVVWKFMRGGYTYTQVTGGLVGAVAGAAAAAALVAVSGVGERIFKNLVWDNSAAVRVRSWNVLDYVHDTDLWFGISIPRIENIAVRVGIDPRYEAIENFWLYMLLLLGIVGFALFVLGLVLLVVHLWRVAKLPLRVALVVYFVLASGANTLASKTVSLLMFTLAVQCAAAIRPLPIPPPPNARRASTGARR
jgi:hypothetical protein